MTGNDKPIFLFVPGAWHQPEAFDGIRALMAKRGLQTAVVALPSVGAEPPTKGLHDDIDHVRATITHLADDGRQVVVVAHSYGGMARSDSGQKGGVIMLVYMTAFVAPKGSTLLDMLGGEWLPWMKFDVS
ncbi:hypothetical protein T310_7809 [Rasamsonia emersonii CBS 393.64]|uniref:AB hydrolase-1 domain-containing protein n=1 Tax=Rasamsonia emersonii (strain ATCC 16479 / CBS 393.64 / IMI 116815) TaxID=1408163 RepID=A0A0F4YKY5_RASE3|nr:hypothetical protein T310_7809 [Rasamsonia emersonii CBS 393.64]KKA18248.1 hypothetical protein T310_7809 [Rasamsonia emersonii CBS 393.64]